MVYIEIEKGNQLNKAIKLFDENNNEREGHSRYCLYFFTFIFICPNVVPAKILLVTPNCTITLLL